MAKLDRYILSQLMGPFAIFSLILIGIYWVGRAIGLFDQLIGDGQSVGVFLEIMILFLPQVVAITLPVVAFAAAIYVSNRLHADSEMVVLQGAGFSPLQLLRPFLIFSVLVALLAASLSNYLVPASQSMLQERRKELAEDMASRLIVGGRFLHPSENVTFFVGDVADDGSLSDLFLHDQRAEGRDVTYTASKAILFNIDDEARLVMFDGLIQTFDKNQLLLTKIQFDEFVFDIGTLTGAQAQKRQTIWDYSTLEALFPTPEMLAATGVSFTGFRIEALRRIEQPIQSLLYPLIGMLVLMSSSFSRFGVARQVFLASAVVIFLNVFSAPFRDIAWANINLWWLLYVPNMLALLLILALLRRNSRAPKPPRAASASGGGA